MNIKTKRSFLERKVVYKTQKTCHKGRVFLSFSKKLMEVNKSGYKHKNKNEL